MDKIELDNLKKQNLELTSKLEELNSNVNLMSNQQLRGPVDVITIDIIRNVVRDIRNYRRIISVDSTSTLIPNCELTDMFIVNSLAAAITINAPIGNPSEGQVIVFRIKDNGTARAITWNAIYRDNTTLAKPTTTTLGKTMYLAYMYNSIAVKWDLLSYLDTF